MQKYLGRVAFGLILIGGITLVVYLSLQPRTSPLVSLTAFASTEKAAEVVLTQMQGELQRHAVLVIGLQPGKPELLRFFWDFYHRNQVSALGFQAAIIDQEIERLIPELKSLRGERINIQQQADQVLQGLKRMEQNQVRTLIVVPLPFAALLVPESWSDGIRARGIVPTTLLIADFPRSRETEKNPFVSCDVAERDVTGAGKLGCEILMTARSQYRNRKNSGELVGLLNLVSSNDHLFLLTREP